MCSYKLDVEKTMLELNTHGFSFLPSVREFVHEFHLINGNYLNHQRKTYQTGGKEHSYFLEKLGLQQLFNEFYFEAKRLYPDKNIENQYLVKRLVRPGQVREGYRGHFDAHLFTLVLPVVIPDTSSQQENGSLFIIPNARHLPKNEFTNLFQKLLWKRRNSREYYAQKIEKGEGQIVNFQDYRPLVFCGVRTFHGNLPLANHGAQRLTLLYHLCDPSPRYGISRVLRVLRQR